MNQRQFQLASQGAVNGGESPGTKIRINIHSSLAFSILAHLLALLATQDAPQFGRLDRDRPIRLEATLKKPEPIPTAPTLAPTEQLAHMPDSSSLSVPAATTVDDGEHLSDSEIVEGPRLIGQPDFSSIEKNRVAIPIHVRLRIVVSAAGLAESVAILEAEPVPKETLEKIKEAFQDARYWPARDAKGAQSAQMDITVNILPYGPFAPISPEIRNP